MRSMHLVRFSRDSGTAEVGLVDGAGGIVTIPGAPTMAQVLGLRVDRVRDLLAEAEGRADQVPADQVTVLAPIDGRTEVWGAGVTYERSRAARVEESGQTSVYDTIYAADRPELFFKAPAWRVVGEGEPGGLRADASNSVPEPELAILVNRFQEIVGATVCDDLTARSIEGANPLYLPQAKMYAGSCVLAARVRPWWEIADPYALPITMRITREGREVFAGESGTDRLHRRLDDLVSWLFRGQEFPDGVVLSTGTGIVPPLDLSLQAGDVVHIEVGDVGVLEHPVEAGLAAASD